MRISLAFLPLCIAVVLSFGRTTVHAQNEILYDPEKGIMFVDKKDTIKKSVSPKPLVSHTKKEGRAESVAEGVPPQILVLSHRDSTDLHIGRKKDPPTLYFMSGIEYFKNGDYPNALNNFLYADSVGRKPIFRLWVGKTQRQLGKSDRMLAIMSDILKHQAGSDVADDALFEMAAFYQDIDDYDTASLLYKKLSEQYPFGESHSTGERYIDIAQEQRKMMRAETNNMLAILGYTNEDVSENYRSFQKNHRLKVTGTGDRATVRAMKRMYQKMLDRENQNAQVKEQAKRYQLWAGVAGVAGFINILFALWLMNLVLARKRHLDQLRVNIAEFDATTLSPYNN
jgi:tetratricopeptide (TPR) repeat protein